MLTDNQVDTAERLIIQMNKIVHAIEQLNDVGAEIGMPACYIRFSISPRIYGENPYLEHINHMLFMDNLERLELLIYTKN
jgi:hypothetical protein